MDRFTRSELRIRQTTLLHYTLLVALLYCTGFVTGCDPGLCQNGGSCPSLTPNATCVCSNGYWGEFCQNALTCGAGTFLNDTECLPCPRGSFRSEAGNDSCTPCPTDHGYRQSTLGEGATNRTECIRVVQMLYFWPQYGPQAGGTSVKVDLNLENLDALLPIENITIAGVPCIISKWNISEITMNNSFNCMTSSASSLITGPLMLKFHGGQTLISNDTFEYKSNPTVLKNNDWTTTLSGGKRLRIYGSNFDAVQQPFVVIYRQVLTDSAVFEGPCEAEGASSMVCYAPDVGRGIPPSLIQRGSARRRRALVSGAIVNSGNLLFFLGFKFDGHTVSWIPDIQILVYEDPFIRDFPGINRVEPYYSDQEYIEIKGDKLNFAMNISDISITIGLDQLCHVTFMTTYEIVCRPPKIKPTTDSSDNSTAAVTVHIGRFRAGVMGLQRTIGYLDYTGVPKPSHGDVTDSYIAGIVVGTVGAVAVVVIGLLVYRYRKQQKKDVKKFSTGEANIYTAFNEGYLEPVNLGRGGPGLQPLNSLTISIPPDDAIFPPGPATPGSYIDLATELPNSVIEQIPRSLQNSVKEHLVPADRLILGQSLGEGHFGQVLFGKLVDENKENSTNVAVKTLHHGRCSVKDITAFLAEAVIMKDFDHVNVLSLVGVVIREYRPHVVLPYMEHGDLRSYIAEPSRTMKVRDLLKYAVQIAAGMKYLSSKRFVHRDLATRNCMINKELVVKIADFGLSRDVYTKEYYRVEDRHRPLPVKWMAIESLTSGIFTTKSDVWSFGVALWEVLTRGSPPYPDVDGFSMKHYLKTGRRLAKPAHCSQQLYSIMAMCWNEYPERRPDFEYLHTALSDIITGKTRDSSISNVHDAYPLAEENLKSYC